MNNAPCTGYANDCTCGCTMPNVGDELRARDIMAGMTIVTLDNERAHAGGIVPLAPMTIENVEYDVFQHRYTNRDGIETTLDVASWTATYDNGRCRITMSDDDNTIARRIA